MNFREKYKEDNEMIKPDVEYIKQLTEQMKIKERQQGRRGRRTWISAAAIAAVILLAGLMGYRLLVPSDKPAPDNTISNLAGVASGSATHGFSSSEDKGRYEQLVSCMEAETVSLEKSETADFVKAETVTEAEKKELLEKMKGMAYRGKTEMTSGAVVFYRIQSRNVGSVIFTVEDSRIVRLLESDGELYM